MKRLLLKINNTTIKIDTFKDIFLNFFIENLDNQATSEAFISIKSIF